MSNNSFVAFVEPQHNTRGSNTTQQDSGEGGSGYDWLPTVWRVTAFLAVTSALLFVDAALEAFFGVFSGFTLLFGPYPAMGFAALLSFGLAAYFVFAFRLPTWRPATATVAFASDTPRPEVRQWKVRTSPRPASKRGTASRKVMEAEL